MSNENLVLLILKELKNEITEAEQNRLNDWRRINSDNERLYQQVIYSWEHAEGYKSEVKIDDEKAKAFLFQKIVDPGNVVELKPYRYVKYIVAASVIGLIAMVSWFALKQNQNTNEWTHIINSTEEKIQVDLPDGSVVNLNEGAKLSFLRDFEERKVEFEGEAFFKIESDSQRPFTVNTYDTRTVVLGTEFNIDSDEQEVVVSLFHGKVAFQTSTENALVLSPGESASYNRKTESIEKLSKRITNDNAWFTKQLSFDQSEISEAIKDIESFYGVSVALNLEGDVPCYFTGNFKDNSFEEVIEVLEFTYDMSIVKKDNKYEFAINNCK